MIYNRQFYINILPYFNMKYYISRQTKNKLFPKNKAMEPSNPTSVFKRTFNFSAAS